MSLATRSQRMAERAYRAVSQKGRVDDKEYNSFAKSFPSLIQAAGLCQAVAFAQAKSKGDSQKAHAKVLNDVLATIELPELATIGEFAGKARTAEVVEYMRLTRVALQAATWVKRYVEALEKPREPRP